MSNFPKTLKNEFLIDPKIKQLDPGNFILSFQNNNNKKKNAQHNKCQNDEDAEECLSVN